eukprot:403339574
MVEATHNKVTIIETQPYQDQKAGTSGLRKKVKVFRQPNYLENFVQSIFLSLSEEEYKGKALVIAGDGRFYNDTATQIIIRIAAANGIKQVYVGQHGLLSTPAASAFIRKLNADHGEDYCVGGVLLTASHNPGGEDEDFGIKFNSRNGGPALENFTNLIFEHTKKIANYRTANLSNEVDLNVIAEHNFGKVEGFEHDFHVSVASATQLYYDLLKTLFDFDDLKKFVQRSDFNMVFDGMHGVSGPYAQLLFHEVLGVPQEHLFRCNVLPDFGHGHPDPNLTYAHDLVEKMGIFHPRDDAPDFGAACDGDADRNMVLGKNFFVTPSDSIAIITANYKSIPFLKAGISGAARSMPTSGALDRVTQKLGINFYETPTGWKFFGNLLDNNMISLCGEESFGTGSFHVREKDGVWAVLCWLSILADKNRDTEKLVSVGDIVQAHWAEYGRNYYQRYDYENLETADADKVFKQLESQMSVFEQEAQGNTAVNFSYTDPVDHSVSNNQGYIFKYADGSRFVFRLSGTGSSGATIRIYLEKYSEDLSMQVEDALKSIAERALSASQIHELSGRTKPTVIT